jgi:hypothetical protein
MHDFHVLPQPFQGSCKTAPKLLMWCLALRLIREIQNWIFDTESSDREKSNNDGFFFFSPFSFFWGGVGVPSVRPVKFYYFTMNEL